MRRALAFAAGSLIAALLVAAPASAATSEGAVVTNGIVTLGVNKDGGLNYDCPGNLDTGCPAGSNGDGTTVVGLRLNAGNLESTAPGCLCEGWGMADAGTGLTGSANADTGPVNITPVSFNATATTAVATVDISDPSIAGAKMRVVHDYHPSPLNPNLYADVVTVTNTGTVALGDIRFRRAMDWDVDPTAFDEWVTNQGTSPQLLFSSDDGFAPTDPLAGPSYVSSEAVCGAAYTGPCSFTDLGSGGVYPAVDTPADHGGLFDFGFGSLAVNASKSFTTYYGAAASETAALAALTAGGAQVYSLGESNCTGDTVATCFDANGQHNGVEAGKPATFMFGFVTTTGDLSIVKSDSPDPVTVGHDLTYTITVTDNGPEAAAGVQVVDQLPAGVTYKSVSTPAGVTCSGTSTVTCDLGSVANGTSKTFTLTVTPTQIGSVSNTATVSSASADAIPGNNSSTATTSIVPDTSVAIGDVAVDPEGNSGTKNATFTVTRSGDSSGTTTVDYATAPGTATSPADFIATSGTLAFTAGQTSKTVDVPIVGDQIDEDNESFTVGLSNASGGAISDGSGTGTIVDDDAPPSISIGDDSTTEGTGPLTFDVTLSAPSSRTVTVNYATANGTAIAPGDYTAASGTLTFTPGQTSKGVSVAVIDDALDEADEALTAGLSGATNATILDASGTGTIADNDPAPAVSVGNASANEGDALSFTVSLGAASGRPVTVHYATSNGTAGAGDYTSTSGDLTFDPGQTSKTVSVPTTEDALDEVDETLTLTLSSPVNATLGTAAGTGTIRDDDNPTVSIGDATVDPEGDAGTKDATFIVALSAVTVQDVTVTATTTDGTAKQPGDYAAKSATVTIPAGQTSATFKVAVAGDALDELDETFVVALSSPSGATVGDGSGTGTIVDDDGPPTVSVASASANEGDALAFTVSLGAASGKTVTVSYATADGSAGASDYTATSGDLTFLPGETSKTVSVPTTEDAAQEPDETLSLTLSSPVNATLGTPSNTGTIVDDDTAATPPVVVPVMGVGNATVSPEGDAGTKDATFTVTLSAPTTVAVSAHYATADGTAHQPADYTAAAGTVSFAAGQTSATVSVPVLGDTVDENDETFTLTLSAPSGATLGAATGTGTIVDDDTAAPETDVPGKVRADGLFCGAQHRGHCNGLKVKSEFSGPGNASWTLGAYNPSPGKSKAGAAAAAKLLKLATIKKAVKRAGRVTVVFKFKGKRARTLLKKVRKAGAKRLRVTTSFVPAGGGAAVKATDTLKLTG